MNGSRPENLHNRGLASRQSAERDRKSKERILLTVTSKEDEMTYRGITYTKEQLITEARKARAGIYRGVKHGPIKTESKGMQQGIYRGIKWSN